MLFSFRFVFSSVYRHGNWLYTSWQNVKVGDIVKVIDKEFFPADLVLLSSGFVAFSFVFVFFSSKNFSSHCFQRTQFDLLHSNVKSRWRNES